MSQQNKGKQSKNNPRVKMRLQIIQNKIIKCLKINQNTKKNINPPQQG
jgi:hypothetical protein